MGKTMRHLPLTLRAPVLLPLLAVGADQTRAALLCGPRAESCLEAASSGWSTVGVLALALYGAGLALLVARIAGGAPGFGRVWALATGAIWTSCAAQAALAAGVGASSALGGGWLGLLALGVLGGAVLALALRVAPAARALVRSLRTAAPRLQQFAAIASRPLQRSPMGASAARLRLTRGRAPPVAA
ncbi:MAG: hypothetical protein QOC68_3827 [Solirubrobacteraceae bacterium]|nr:hypothetical protein [Solirubrobacteraceae bacterium]